MLDEGLLVTVDASSTTADDVGVVGVTTTNTSTTNNHADTSTTTSIPLPPPLAVTIPLLQEVAVGTIPLLRPSTPTDDDSALPVPLSRPSNGGGHTPLDVVGILLNPVQLYIDIQLKRHPCSKYFHHKLTHLTLNRGDLNFLMDICTAYSLLKQGKRRDLENRICVYFVINLEEVDTSKHTKDMTIFGKNNDWVDAKGHHRLEHDSSLVATLAVGYNADAAVSPSNYRLSFLHVCDLATTTHLFKPEVPDHADSYVHFHDRKYNTSDIEKALSLTQTKSYREWTPDQRFTTLVCT